MQGYDLHERAVANDKEEEKIKGNSLNYWKHNQSVMLVSNPEG